MIKRAFPFAIALVVILAFWIQPPAQGGGKEWFTDIDRAMQQASNEKKDLLLDFTGSDWCEWCMRLNEEVFTKPEFESAKDHFVLVELDFPNDESKVPSQTRKQNEQWQAKLGVEGFPTVFLADALGRPYAMTGYQDGGVGPYLQHLAELRKIREVRDKAFAAAKQAAGAERAQHLHEGLSAMHGDFVIFNYRHEVEEIIALDAGNAMGLQQKYRHLLVESDARQKAMRIARRISDLATEQGREAAAALLDEELANAGDDLALRHKIQILRINVVSLSKLPDADAVLDELLTSEFVDNADKLNLRLQRAYWLAESDRLDEASNQFEVAAAEADEDDLKARLFYMKAEMLEERGRLEDARASYEKMIELAGPASDMRLYGQQRLGDLLVRLSRPAEALALYESLLDSPQLELPIRINLLSGKAVAQLASGQRDAALQTARSAKELAAAAGVGGVDDVWLEEATARIEAVIKEAYSPTRPDR